MGYNGGKNRDVVIAKCKYPKQAAFQSRQTTVVNATAIATEISQVTRSLPKSIPPARYVGASQYLTQSLNPYAESWMLDQSLRKMLQNCLELCA